VSPSARSSGIFLTFLLAAAPLAAARGYQHFLVGNPADVVTPTRGLLVLQGGGTDVDQNFIAMGARSGGGDFVVIRVADLEQRPVRDHMGEPHTPGGVAAVADAARSLTDNP